VKTSPLHQKHLNLQAKMADFGGWLMPIEYPGAGVLAEHAAVRENVGLFDVSHLGKAKVTGEGALEFLNTQFTNDLNRIEDGKAQYTLFCTPQGGVIDDLIVYRNSETDLFLIPNAANTSAVVQTLQHNAPAGIAVSNLHNEFAVLALQGPKAREVLTLLGVNPDMDYMAFTHSSIAGCEVILCRTGYTGEHGYEIVPQVSDASRVWEAINEAMLPLGGLNCGLGARDTLRTEKGYCLYGHDIDDTTSPIEAGLGWITSFNKDFIMKDHHAAIKANGPSKKLVGFEMIDRGIPRQHYPILNAAGETIGEVTSGTQSPSLSKGIGMGYVSTKHVGSEIFISIRDKAVKAEIVKLPFL